jgi:hypothetical protein
MVSPKEGEDNGVALQIVFGFGLKLQSALVVALLQAVVNACLRTQRNQTLVHVFGGGGINPNSESQGADGRNSKDSDFSRITAHVTLCPSISFALAFTTVSNDLAGS